MARHHCCCRPVQGRPALPQWLPAGVPLLPIPENRQALRASRAADPYSLADADRRPRHRALCLCAGAAGHARRAGLVVFRGRLHEYRQCRGLSRRRADRGRHRQALRARGRAALGNAGLRAVAGAVCAVGQFCHSEFRAAIGRHRRRGRLRLQRRAGGDDCAIAARAGKFPAQPVLCRARPRHRAVRPDRAVRAAGGGSGIVVDRVVGDDGVVCRDDLAVIFGAVRRRRRHSRFRRR